MKDTKFGFQRVLANVERMKKELPFVVANQAQNFFVRRFTLQSWDGSAWKEVKRRIEGTPEYKYPKYKGLSRRTSPILVRTGRLRRAVSNSIKEATWERVLLVVEAPGAAALNDGAPENNLEARTYMKHSPLLDAEIKVKIIKYVDKVWLN